MFCPDELRELALEGRNLRLQIDAVISEQGSRLENAHRGGDLAVIDVMHARELKRQRFRSHGLAPV